VAEPLEGQLANLLHHGVGSLPAGQQDRLASFIADLDLPDESVASKPQLTQSEATYTERGPDPFLCASCSLFVPVAPPAPAGQSDPRLGGSTDTKGPRPSGACALVEGDINPAGACRFWRGDRAAVDDEATEAPAMATVAVMNRTGA
jgi:hypothetical protein